MLSEIAKNFNDILGIIVVLSIFMFAVSYSVTQWRNGTSKANLETIETYQNEIEAIKESVRRLSEDNVKLRSEVQELRGANEALTKALSLREPDFLDKIKNGYEDMSRMYKCLTLHDERAQKILEETRGAKQDLDHIKDFCDNSVKDLIERANKHYQKGA